MTSNSRSTLLFEYVSRAAIIFTAALLPLVAGAACRSSQKSDAPGELIVIKAPAAGEVRRVLVSEGAEVVEGAALIEIAIKLEGADRQQGQVGEKSRSLASVGAAQKEVAEAEAEVNRSAVEAQRVEPLVTSGAAPQAQLDAARAQHQQAQEKLQRARERIASAERNFVSNPAGAVSAAQQAESIIAVRVPASGTMRVISARAGQQVVAGQPIATLKSYK